MTTRMTDDSQHPDVVENLLAMIEILLDEADRLLRSISWERDQQLKARMQKVVNEWRFNVKAVNDTKGLASAIHAIHDMVQYLHTLTQKRTAKYTCPLCHAVLTWKEELIEGVWHYVDDENVAANHDARMHPTTTKTLSAVKENPDDTSKSCCVVS